jgi:hypothetical protein
MTAPLGGEGDRSWFWSAFALCAALALVPLWCVKYLPMVDLPQHASQIAIWTHLHDPRYGFEAFFELHYFTPYVAAYGLARLLAEGTSVLVALKVVISLSVLALPLSFVPFFRRMAVSRWWSLLGFPLAYGYSFTWGFLSFMMGVPIAFLFLTAVVGYARAPTARGGLLIGAFILALFWVHVLLLLFCQAIAAAIIVGQTDGARGVVKRALPLLLPAPILVGWFLMDRHRTQEPMAWTLGVDRLFHAFAFSGYYARPAAVAAIIATGAIILLRERDSPRGLGLTWLPYALTAVVVLFWPRLVFGTARIAPRFNIFLLPFLVAWLRPAFPAALRAALVGATAAWMALLTFHFVAFDRDGRDYEDIATVISPRPRIRPIIYAKTDDEIPFLHFPAWTQVEKGGLYGFSFAINYPVVRYRPDAPRLMAADAEWFPERFDWRREAPRGYDYYVVRSEQAGPALTESLFKGATVALLAEKGMWHVYGARPPQGSGP